MKRGTYTRTPETLAKLSAAMKKRGQDPVFRKRMSDAMKRRWARDHQLMLDGLHSKRPAVCERRWRDKVRKILGPEALEAALKRSDAA